MPKCGVMRVSTRVSAKFALRESGNHVFLRGFEAPGAPILRVLPYFLRAGNPEATYFYEDSTYLVRQSYVFYRTSCTPGRGVAGEGGVGLPGGCPKGPGGRIAGTREKTRGIRGPGAPNRVKNACGWVTLRRAVGWNFSSTAPGGFPPDPRNTDPRALRRFLPNRIGSVLGNAYGAVG